MSKRKILLMNTHYLPGYKDGGPLRTCKNVSDILGDEFDIRILCLDRDLGDTEPYDNIRIDEYNKVGKSLVYYASKFDFKTIKKCADDVDLVYCCGPFGTYSMKSLFLKRLGLIKADYVLAPQGCLSPGAYAIKHKKKAIYIALFKIFGLFKNIKWSMTSDMELSEVKAVIGDKLDYEIACDLPRLEGAKHTKVKEKDSLDIVFLSRIVPKKNLDYAINLLDKIDDKYRVTVHIWGNIEDSQYWNKCENMLKQIANAHPNVSWEYKGVADSEEVPKVFAGYDVFLFPTLSENYGHVIAESLSAGCIPIISDQTPWHDIMDNNAGFEYALSDTDKFIECINEMCAFDAASFEDKSQAAVSYITRKNEESIISSGYRKIFAGA